MPKQSETAPEKAPTFEIAFEGAGTSLSIDGLDAAKERAHTAMEEQSEIVSAEIAYKGKLVGSVVRDEIPGQLTTYVPALDKVKAGRVVRYGGKRYRAGKWCPPVTQRQKRHQSSGEWDLISLDPPEGRVMQQPAEDVFCRVDDNLDVDAE